ncbi:pikachurin-like [Plakobranchus ocellatus]|uniref:Pikachurin-like n=1 Tax=Plakobranchus ocellatus TaxID=259542 RepID=A0AAV4DU67_9GAST|nr:pikachurin-like [Plakobranchus ocellatus]
MGIDSAVVAVDDKTIDLYGPGISGSYVGDCTTCLSVHEPCFNGGLCKEEHHTYTCYCPLGFSNTKCEDVQEPVPTIPMFTGKSYLEYTDKELINRVKSSFMDLRLEILPRSSNGVIFWSGQFSKDFLGLGLSGGVLQLRYNLGGGEALLSYNASELLDYKWHSIWVRRNQQKAYMIIDCKIFVEGRSPGRFSDLNTNNLFYLGGIPNEYSVTGGRFQSSFHGCVRSMKLAESYDVNLLGQSNTEGNIEQCETES